MHSQTMRRTIDDEVDHFARDLTAHFGKRSRVHRELELSELDVAQFLATQLVVPILASFLSSLLYDTYKNLKTKKQAQDAQDKLCEVPVPPRRPIPKELVVKEMSEKLTISVESKEAATIVTNCYERIERQFEHQQSA